MFLWLCNGSNLNLKCDNMPIKDLMNDWQIQIYEKYVRNTFLTKYTFTEA